MNETSRFESDRLKSSQLESINKNTNENIVPVQIYKDIYFTVHSKKCAEM